MKNNNFQLVVKSKNLAVEIMHYSVNFPKKYLVINNKLQEFIIKIIENCNYYIINKNENKNIKIKYLKNIYVSLSMIDYFLLFFNNEGVIGNNKNIYFTKKIEELKKILDGVIIYEKK